MRRDLDGETFKTVFDSGYRPSFEDSKAVLAFVLAPLSVLGHVPEEDREVAAELFMDAKRRAISEWIRISPEARWLKGNVKEYG